VIQITSNEIWRKILHIFSSIVPLLYLWIIKDKGIMCFILFILSTIAIIIEIARNRSEKTRIIFNRYFGFMLRDKELKGNLTGATWMLIGWTITIFCFPKYIAVPALLFLSVGDSFAAIIGKMYPIFKVKDKSLSGTFAGTITSIIAVILINQQLPLIVIIIGAISAMVIELVPLPINDNLIIPNFSAIIMMINLYIL